MRRRRPAEDDDGDGVTGRAGRLRGRAVWTTGLLSAGVVAAALLDRFDLGVLVSVPLALAVTGTRLRRRPHAPRRPRRRARRPGASEIAARLEGLCVLDVTAEVAEDVAFAGGSGLAVLGTCSPGWVVCVNERESGFFGDLERLLERVAAADAPGRERLLTLLLGPTGESLPFTDGVLALGVWQRILLVGLGAPVDCTWSVTTLGSGGLLRRQRRVEVPARPSVVRTLPSAADDVELRAAWLFGGRDRAAGRPRRLGRGRRR